MDTLTRISICLMYTVILGVLFNITEAKESLWLCILFSIPSGLLLASGDTDK